MTEYLYFKKNLKNSRNLPYDIMLNIYEYIDVLGSIRKQIDNKEYDLDDLMYKKMKKYIIERYTANGRAYQLLKITNNERTYLYINSENINDENLKHAILNFRGGYKDYFFFKTKQPMYRKICGLDWYSNPNGINRYYMMEAINFKNRRLKLYDKSYKQLFALWLKL